MTQHGTALLPPHITPSPHPPFDQQSDVGNTSVNGKSVKWRAAFAQPSPYDTIASAHVAPFCCQLDFDCSQSL